MNKILKMNGCKNPTLKTRTLVLQRKVKDLSNRVGRLGGGEKQFTLAGADLTMWDVQPHKTKKHSAR